MKALMIHSEDSAVGSYRIWQPAKFLPNLGWDIRRLPNKTPELPNDRETGESTKDSRLKYNYKKYGSWEDLAEGVDIMILQRSDVPQAIALALAIREQYGIPIVYEIDDNIYDVSKNSPSFKYWYPGSPLIEVAELFMQHVDAITVTTDELAKVYAKHNKNIYVLPNCQNPDEWEGISRPSNEDKIIIGWAGGYTHYDDLKVIARPIKNILKKNKNVIFRIIGTLPDFLRDVPGVEFKVGAVHSSKWPAKLASMNFDIGLAPIQERPFNAGKSDIKWQEYSMLEIPTIASNFGPYKSIDHMEMGLLSENSAHSWEYNLQKLIDNEELRRSLGVAAKRKMLESFTIQKNITRWDSAYRDIINNFKPIPG